MTTPEEAINTFVADLRRQIGIAEDAGAEHDDLCVVFPAGFFAMAAGWPTIDVDGAEVAVVPKLWARDKADEAIGETAGYRPPPDSGQQGLWGFSSGFGGLR